MTRIMRFSLRRMFFITATCAVTIALLLWATENYRRQRAVRADLMDRGAAWVAFPLDQSGSQPSLVFNQPITGDLDKYQQFNYVELQGYAVTSGCLKRLSAVRHISGLYFISCKLDCDLASLAPVSVSSLLFWNVDITDESLDSISTIPGLKEVTFKTTLVTRDGAERLRTSLPNVDVRWKP